MPEDMPDRTPDRMSERMPEDMPDKVPECLPDRMPEDMPDRMPEGMPDRMSDRMPEGMPDKVPEGMSDRTPEDLPVRMPEGMPDRMSDRMPEGMPDKVPQCLPEHMPEDLPEDMPDRMSEDMPEDVPDRMPEDMPDKMPEGMSDRMPEDLPVTKRIDVMVGITRSKVIWSCFWPENLPRERWCPGIVEPYDANSGVRKSNPSDAAAAKTGGKMHPRHLKWLIIIIIIAMLHQAPTMTPGEMGEGVMAARHKSHLTNPGGIHHVTPGSPRGAMHQSIRHPFQCPNRTSSESPSV